MRRNFSLILNKNESNFQDGLDNLLERCERVKQKFGSKQLDESWHREDEAIKMPKELKENDAVAGNDAIYKQLEAGQAGVSDLKKNADKKGMPHAVSKAIFYCNIILVQFANQTN